MSNIDRAEQLPLRDDLLTMKNCLHAQFEQIALRTPNQVAIVLDGQSLTYGELNRQANVVANQLIAAGVGNKDMVGLALPRDLSLLPGLIGILKTGAAYVPLDPNYPQARLDDIVEDCKAAAIVTTSQIASDIRLDGTLIKLDELQKSAAWHDESESQSPDVAISPDDIAYVIYTSGSTGKPKGVLVSHTNVIRLYTETHGWFQFNRHDTWTLFHSFAFDFSVWEIWGALLYGGKLAIIPFEMSRSPVEFYKVLASEHVTILNQTPSAFRQLILADERLHQVYELSLRLVVFGGEALEFSSLRGWVQRHEAKAVAD